MKRKQAPTVPQPATPLRVGNYKTNDREELSGHSLEVTVHRTRSKVLSDALHSVTHRTQTTTPAQASSHDAIDDDGFDANWFDIDTDGFPISGCARR